MIPQAVQFTTFYFYNSTSDWDQKSRWRSLKIIVFYVDRAFVISVAYF